jgi:hypothetical protein
MIISKTFIPNTAVLDKKTLTAIKESFAFLTAGEIVLLSHWNAPASPYTGTIICESTKHHAYPYDRDSDGFLAEMASQGHSGKIWPDN